VFTSAGQTTATAQLWISRSSLRKRVRIFNGFNLPKNGGFMMFSLDYFLCTKQCFYFTVTNFIPPTPIETVTVMEGAPFERQCLAPMSVPKARVYWVLADQRSDVRRFRAINQSNVAQNPDVS